MGIQTLEAQLLMLGVQLQTLGVLQILGPPIQTIEVYDPRSASYNFFSYKVNTVMGGLK